MILWALFFEKKREYREGKLSVRLLFVESAKQASGFPRVARVRRVTGDALALERADRYWGVCVQSAHARPRSATHGRVNSIFSPFSKGEGRDD